MLFTSSAYLIVLAETLSTKLNRNSKWQATLSCSILTEKTFRLSLLNMILAVGFLQNPFITLGSCKGIFLQAVILHLVKLSITVESRIKDIFKGRVSGSFILCIFSEAVAYKCITAKQRSKVIKGKM